MLIDLFIKAGWHTVPLKGKLERLDSGKKTLPQFEPEWRKKYTAEFNEESLPLGGAITGAKSGVIAIDCDNQLTYDLFKGLDPDYNFHFVSLGKPEGGGTIIYKYNPTVGGFKLSTEAIKLDFFSDEGFVYLPTENNKTKVSWEGTTELPEIKEVPDTILATLQAFKSKVPDHTVAQTNMPKHTISNRLAPLLEVFVKNGKYDPTLFKVLTPYSFRDLPTYVSRGHLHPNDVPDGRGSEYLSKISAIIGADISVNIELYTKVIMLINSLWAKPMDKTKLLSTVINPMVEERATIDGHVIWQYDSHWEKMGFIATCINGDYVEAFYDDVKSVYYLINYTVPYIKVLNDKSAIVSMLKALLGRPVTELQFDSTKQIIRTTLNPSMEFGHIEGTDRYNLFRQTQELSIIVNPTPYASQYTRPVHIIQYFETLIPDDTMRAYILSFIKTKLLTFKYSPVVIYLLGKSGSGKDTMVNILRRIVGDEYVSKPDSRVFLEQYNGWMIDKFFIQLDEYGNKLTRSAERQEALGKIKAYSGSDTIQIRAMRNDGFNYKHSMTQIMTANTNPLPVDADDRRFAFVKTPNKLAIQDWVVQAGGISHVHDLIMAEIMDFCYYLATEVPQLKADAYVQAPMTEDKERMILDSMPAAEQISYYIQNTQFNQLRELADEFGIKNFDENWERNKLQDDKMEELYTAMTEGAGSHRTLIRMLKGIGLSRSHTTKQGRNDFYYFINDLHHFAKEHTTEADFQPSKSKAIKGLN